MIQKGGLLQKVDVARAVAQPLLVGHRHHLHFSPTLDRYMDRYILRCGMDRPVCVYFYAQDSIDPAGPAGGQQADYIEKPLHGVNLGARRACALPRGVDGFCGVAGFTAAVEAAFSAATYVPQQAPEKLNPKSAFNRPPTVRHGALVRSARGRGAGAMRRRGGGGGAPIEHHVSVNIQDATVRTRGGPNSGAGAGAGISVGSAPLETLLQEAGAGKHAEVLRYLKKTLDDEKSEFSRLQQDVFDSLTEHEVCMYICVKGWERWPYLGLSEEEGRNGV